MRNEGADLDCPFFRGKMAGRMNTAKDEVRKLLDRLPEGASFEDIQYQVFVLDEITRGAEEIDRGEGVEHEEAKRRLAKWLGK